MVTKNKIIDNAVFLNNIAKSKPKVIYPIAWIKYIKIRYEFSKIIVKEKSFENINPNIKIAIKTIINVYKATVNININFPLIKSVLSRPSITFWRKVLYANSFPTNVIKTMVRKILNQQQYQLVLLVLLVLWRSRFCSPLRSMPSSRNL